jgi:zinc/manganese transport system ATP-binding protein/zinc transport system ATP-binding protein
LIRLHDVTAGYRLDPVFAHLSLAIPAGSFSAIVGPTGAGKSTLLRVCLGLVPVSAGRVLIGDKSIKQGVTRIGYVPQHGTTDRFFPATVEEVILMGLASRSYRPWFNRIERDQVHRIAARLGVTDCLHHHICDVSGGQQRRALLARALVCDPQLLVLDEPTAGVDLATQQICMALLDELNQQGITVLLTTHDLNGIAVHLPHVVCFNAGLVAQGAPHEVFSDAVLAETFGEALTAIEHAGRLVIAGQPLLPRQFKASEVAQT